MVEGSMEGWGGFLDARSRKARAEACEEPSGGRWVARSEFMMARMVWRGRSGSQESSQEALGTKPVEVEWMTGAWEERDVELFWREKEGWPAGRLPRAFSDMPRSWRGTVLLSIEEDREGEGES